MDATRLLLIEDKQEQALLIERVLGRHERRFQVTIAESGEACLAALAEANYDLVLLDYRLPGDDGLDVLRKIRRAGYRVPIIMMTAYGDEAVAVEAMKAGAADYVVKQVGYLPQLASAISQVLERHQLETELLASQRRYRALFESSRDAIFILDSETQVVDLNPRAETLLGAAHDQVLGRRIFDLIHPEQPEQITSWQQQLRTRDVLSNITVSFVNRQGVRYWVEVNAIWLGPLFAVHPLDHSLKPDQIGYYQVFLRDVTRAKRDQAVWDALNRAALAAHNQLEPMAIYRAVAHTLLELGLASSMWWLEDETQALQVRFTTYSQEIQDWFAEKTGLDVENLWVPVDRLTLFRDQVAHGEIIYLDDGAELARQIINTDDAELIDRIVERFNGNKVILLPFAIAGQVAGMLLIHGDLSARSVPAARAFAAQISSALEHARLYGDTRRRIRELSALQEISFKLSSALEIRPLLEAITDMALKITDAHNCCIYLAGEGTLSFAAARRRDGNSAPLANRLCPGELVARVARTAEPLLIDNVQHNPLYQTLEVQRWGVEAIAGYPLLRGGQVLGVFTLAYLEPHHFDQAEWHVLSLLADQVATAVETARLYEDLRRRNEDLSTLYQISLAVSAQLNISAVLDVTFEAVSRATGARSFVVGLYDEATDELAFKMMREEGKDISHPNLSVSDSQSLTAWMVQNRQELLIGDVHSDLLPVPGITVGGPVRSWMGFPLIVGERLIGVMSVQSHHPNVFDVGHQRLCRGIATQVAMALDKARLLEEIQQQNWELSILNRVSATVSHSFDLESLLDEALSIVMSEMRWKAGAFHLLEDDGFTLASQSNLPPGAVRDLAPDTARDLFEIAPDEGVAGQVMLAREPILTSDYRQPPSWLDTVLDDDACFAVVPLSAQDHVVGMLSVLDPGPRQLTPLEINLLMAIGQQIGVAVENVMLYRKTIDRERRLRRLYEAAHSLSSVLESRALFQRVLEMATGELRVGGALLWLHDEQGGLYPHLALGTLSRQQAESDPLARAEMEQVSREQLGTLWGNHEHPQRWGRTEIAGKRGYRVAVPLRGQASEVGVLEVVAAAARDHLTGDDVDFVSTLGGIAAIAYENAQLYKTLAQYASSLESTVKERTAEIRREKEQTEVILRSVADGIFVVDNQSNNIVLTNPAAEALLSVPEQSERLREHLKMIARQPDSATPGPTITLDEQTLQARAAKIRQEDVELGTVIALRDVTHFEQVNRLKSEFVSTVSHELRTPLSNLKLYLALLEKGRVERRGEYQRVLAQEVNRLENLIQDLLDLSRLESRERIVVKERLNLWEVTSHVLTTLAPQAEAKPVTLTGDCDVQEARLWVQANRDQMVQMAINLIANAVSYTEPGGRVTIKLGAQTDTRGRWVTLAVKDTGVGIARNDLPRIWDRFFRGPLQRHMSAGTGLGLSIVKQILDQHDGWITVESEAGVGSLFTVGLPSAAAPHRGTERETFEENLNGKEHPSRRG